MIKINEAARQNIVDSYQGYNEHFVADLKVAWKAHEIRVAAMHKAFKPFFIEAAGQLGCNEQCVFKAVSNKYRNFSEVMPKCGCGAGAWKV